MEWRPYVSVAKRRANASRYAAKLRKQGHNVSPIEIEGRKIARTFWGEAWCDNLESYSDFANRLPRGRTYVRNGSVIDLQIKKGSVTGLVSGSSIYKVDVQIAPVTSRAWTKVKKTCAGSIDSLMDLLQGSFSTAVMQQLTHQDGGLFPKPKDIKLGCSCPDWASMCKHVAAVLYGIGARLDDEPELLFVLRDVDHLELLTQATSTAEIDKTLSATGGRTLDSQDLGDVFGIDLDLGEQDMRDAEGATKSRRGKKKTVSAKTTRKSAKPKATKRKASGSTSARKKTSRKVTKKAGPAKKTASAKKTAKAAATSAGKKKSKRTKKTTERANRRKKVPLGV